MDRAEVKERLSIIYHLLKQFDDRRAARDGLLSVELEEMGSAAGTVWRTVGLWLLFGGVSAVAVMSIGLEDDQAGGVMEVLTMLVSPALALLLVLRWRSRVLRENEEKRQRNDALGVEHAKSVQPQVEALDAEIARDLDAATRDFFPRSYLNADTVCECWHLVADYRASTVSEAISEYERILHRRRLEDHAAAQVAAADRTASMVAISTVMNMLESKRTRDEIRDTKSD